MGSKPKTDGFHGDSPGKIFIGGLPKDTTYATFNKHFGKYGEIVDSVIMKDRNSGVPRGFGFITYADPSVVDKVIDDDQIINGKQVEIKRTIPKGSGQQKDFKTKKVFVGGIPTTATEDELKGFFSKYGDIAEHQIIRDHETNRSRGFGFVVFEEEDVVDELLSQGNMIEFAGAQVEIKKAEPKKASNPPPSGSAYGSNPRGRSMGENFGGHSGRGGPYGGFEAGFAPGPYRTPGGLPRLGGYGGGYGAGPEFPGGYGVYGNNSLGGYREDPSLGYYSSRFGSSYGAGFSGGYDGSGLGGYGRGEGYGNYGASGYGSGYESGTSGGYNGAGAGGAMYGKGGYSGSNRYHPYTR